MEHEIDAIIESILFASGDPVPAARLAALLDVSEDEVYASAQRLADAYSYERRGFRLLHLEKAFQLCSAPEYGEYVRRALETRKPSKLSASAMEVLTLVAYFQPVTRTYIEQIRGVDSSYTVGLLVEKELIEPCGRLDVPGRPVIYRTTPGFLRAFGLTSLDELPPQDSLPESSLFSGTEPGEMQLVLPDV